MKVYTALKTNLSVQSTSCCFFFSQKKPFAKTCNLLGIKVCRHDPLCLLRGPQSWHRKNKSTVYNFVKQERSMVSKLLILISQLYPFSTRSKKIKMVIKYFLNSEAKSVLDEFENRSYFKQTKFL